MVVVKYGPVTRHYAKGITNRRALLAFGILLTAVGVAGFFVDSRPGDAYYLGTGQNIAYLIIGLASLQVGEVWSSEWKRAFLGLEGLFFLGVAIAGFAVSGSEGHNLGIFNVEHPWESVAHLLLGLIALGVVLYPRRFRDYSLGTNVSD